MTGRSRPRGYTGDMKELLYKIVFQGYLYHLGSVENIQKYVSSKYYFRTGVIPTMYNFEEQRRHYELQEQRRLQLQEVHSNPQIPEVQQSRPQQEEQIWLER